MISVVIPTYNSSSTILAAIGSIISQTLQCDEIIIIDDGSNDITFDLISVFIDSGVVKYFKKVNGGSAAARNLGIQCAKGDYIAFLDADDEWLPHHLEKSLELLISGDFDWIAGGYYKYQANGSKLYKTISGNNEIVYNEMNSSFKLLQNGLFWFSSVPILTSTLLYKSAVLKNIGFFDVSSRFSEDWDLFLRTEEAGYRGGFIDEPQVIYNFSPLGITKSKTFDVLKDHILLARRHAEILGINKPYVRTSYSDFCWQAGRTFLVMKYHRAAVDCFLKSLRFDFRMLKIINPIISRFKIFFSR